MKLVNPVKGARLLFYPYGNITQIFGANPGFYLLVTKRPGHAGLDIAKPKGTPILATQGQVAKTGQSRLGGKYVRILTPAIDGTFYELYFGHLDTISVKKGQQVVNEQQIGTMGNTGLVSSWTDAKTVYWGDAPGNYGVHLHFGVKECSVEPTDKYLWRLGKKVYIVNYDNKFIGYISPMRFLNIPKDLKRKVQTIAGLIAALKQKIEEFLKGKGR